MGGIWIALLALVIAAAVLIVTRAIRRRERETRAVAPSAPVREPVRVDDRLSLAELDEARAHARALTEIVERMGAELRAGMTTHEIDARIETEIVARGLVPVMKGYNGAPAATMFAVNDEVLHAPPSRDRVLADGDLVTIQTAARGRRIHAAVGRTYVVGVPSERAQRVLEVTQSALERAIDAARVGNRIGDIGFAIQSQVERSGLAAVREYVGYGIGRSLMLPPQLPGYGRPGTGMRLREGMLLNLHAIAKEGGFAVSVGDDGWTVRGAPGELSSLATAMVWLGRDRTEVLTALPPRTAPPNG